MSWEKAMSPIKTGWKMLELEKYFSKNLQEIDCKKKPVTLKT